jgi:lysophospholipase L1-like esterase
MIRPRSPWGRVGRGTHRFGLMLAFVIGLLLLPVILPAPRSGFQAQRRPYSPEIQANTTQRQRVDCHSLGQRYPRLLTLLVVGQSNAANHGLGLRTPSGPVFNLYWGDGYCYQARDPLLGATGEGASVWTRVAQRLIDQKWAEAVVIVPAAVGGSSIRQWDRQGNLHALLQRAIAVTQQAGLPINYVLYHQGESDATFRDGDKVLKVGLTTSEYQQHLVSLILSLRQAGVLAPVYVAMASRCSVNPPDLAVLAGQLSTVNPSLGIFLGPNTDDLTGDSRYDGCHFSDQGLDRFADRWLELLRAGRLIMGESVPFPMP